MLLVPMKFVSLTGRLRVGGKRFDWANVIFAAYFILRGRDNHIVTAVIFFWLARFALWCKSIFFDLFLSVKLFIFMAAKFNRVLGC